MYRLITILFVIGILFFGAVSWIARYLSPQDELRKSDAIVAISGGDTSARTKEAIRLYKNGWAEKLIFSGAALDPLSPSNAEAMQELANESGIPEEDIYLEETAQNTAQNALGSTQILKDLAIERVILVTSPYHQRRAYLEFQNSLSERIEIINHSAPDEDWERNNWWRTPRGWYLTVSEAVKIPLAQLRNLL